MKITELARREYKRQGLVPFPRVGRTPGSYSRGSYYPKSMQPQHDDYVKRVPMSGTGAGVSSHSGQMWFGPRLGKRAHDQGEMF